FFLYTILLHPDLHSFPTRRSSDLICPEPVSWGGLSGSTYTEAVSWGKFVPREEGGQFAEVFDDATVALPLIAGAVLQRLGHFKQDRKSTRLNSSHLGISYAVFCLK